MPQNRRSHVVKKTEVEAFTKGPTRIAKTANESARQIVFRCFGRRNPFLQHRRQPLFEGVEGRIPAARFSRNKRQVGQQVIRFSTNLQFRPPWLLLQRKTCSTAQRRATLLQTLA